MERLSITNAILATRNHFIHEYRRGTMGSKLLTYEPKLDREVYKTLKTFEHIPDTSSYMHVRNELNAQTTFSVETFIGERLNVGLSEFQYDIRDGKLYGEGMTEPLLDMIKRGRDCRNELADDIDKPRQDAEIEQFKKIENVFGNPQTELGTTIISISPPGEAGSAYAHNFYDVFVLSEDEKSKKRIVKAHRFASELSLDEYKEKAQRLVPNYFAERKSESIDSYFLSHPLVVDASSQLSGNPDAIHADFHTGHEFLSTKEFGEVKKIISGLIVSYINTLVETPDNEQFLNLTLNAIMNKADEVADNMRHALRRGEVYVHKETYVGPMRGHIMELGKKQVRQTATGCGDSSGFETNAENRLGSNMSKFSSVDFGTDKFGSRTFNCPECGEMNIRPNNQLVSECQHCGSEKVSC